MRNSDIFCLGSVDKVSQNPAAIRTVCIELFFTVIAFSAGGDTGNKDFVAFLKVSYRFAHFFHNTHSFVSQNPSRSYSRHISFQDMQVGSANGRFYHFYNHIG